MRKLFYKHATLYTLSSVLTKGISVLLVPLYTRYLSPRDYGLLDLILATCTLVNLTIALEIHQAIARYYHEWTPGQRRRYISTATLFALLVYTAFAVGFALAARPLIQSAASTEVGRDVVVGAAVLIWTTGIFYLIQSQLRWSAKANAYIVSSLLFTATTAVVTPILLLTRNRGVVDMVTGLSVGNLVGIAYAVVRSREHYIAYFSGARLAKMIRFSGPLVFSSLAVFGTMYMDRFIILARLTVDDLGIFSLATKFASVTGLALVGINAALTPLIYQHHQAPETRGHLEAILRKYTQVAGAIVLGALWFSEEALAVLTTRSFWAASTLVAPLVLASLVSAMYNFFPGLALAKKTKTIALINLGSVALNFTVTSVLVHYFGILGAPLGAVVVAACVTASYFVLGQAHYAVHPGARFLWESAALLAASWVAASLLPRGISPVLIAGKLVLCLAGLAGFYLLGRSAPGARAGGTAVA